MLQQHLLRLGARRSLRALLQPPHALEIALPRPPYRSAHRSPPWPPQPMRRDWLARLWAEDKRAAAEKGRRGEERRSLGGWDPFFAPSHWKAKRAPSGERPWSDGEVEGDVYGRGRSGRGSSLLPTSLEEAKIAPLLARSDLVITRDIEWANLMFAFEQESRYNIVDPHHPHAPVGSVHEQSNVIYRQLLRTRRPFIAYVIDPYGNEIFRVRRPFWWINSTIYVEVDDKEIGVVHRRWHLWRRIYDLYLGNKQFAVVENPGFWNWTFTLKDEMEKVLAEINRDWRGFGFELFTDAGQYVIRFGLSDSAGTSSMSSHIQDFETERPLTLSERAIAVALAVSLDCDYFSRHGGWNEVKIKTPMIFGVCNCAYLLWVLTYVLENKLMEEAVIRFLLQQSIFQIATPEMEEGTDIPYMILGGYKSPTNTTSAASLP